MGLFQTCKVQYYKVQITDTGQAFMSRMDVGMKLDMALLVLNVSDLYLLPAYLYPGLLENICCYFNEKRPTEQRKCSAEFM